MADEPTGIVPAPHGQPASITGKIKSFFKFKKLPALQKTSSNSKTEEVASPVNAENDGQDPIVEPAAKATPPSAPVAKKVLPSPLDVGHELEKTFESFRIPCTKITYNNTALVPSQPQSPAQSPKWKSMLERQQKKGEQLELAQNKIWRRGRDVWDADNWVELREQFISSGDWDMVGGLLSLAGRATSEAIRTGKYYLPPPDGEISLKNFADSNPVTQWFGAKNVTLPEVAEGGEPPPLICTTKSPVDVVSYLKGHFERARVCFAIEVTDFSADGTKLRGMDARNRTQHDLFLRSDFERFSDRAAKLASNGHASMRHHLTAINDPFVFAARDVNIFRDSAEDGYHFISQPLQCDVVVSARACERPAIVRCKEGPENAKTTVLDSRGAPVEFFADQEMFTSFLERLNLMGLVALNARDDDCKPFLVLSATDLRLQPRHSIARALKHWRRSYAFLFEGVVVACGDDHDTADLFDEEINSDIYDDQALQRSCDPALLELSVNPELIDIGNEHESNASCNEDAMNMSMPRRGSRCSIHDNLGNAMRDMLSKPTKRGSKQRTSVVMDKWVAVNNAPSGSKEPVARPLHVTRSGQVVPVASSSTSTRTSFSSGSLARGASKDPFVRGTPAVLDDKNSPRSRPTMRKAMLPDVGAAAVLQDESHRRGGNDDNNPMGMHDEVRSLALFVNRHLNLRRNPLDK